jgi:hypothetical protein
MLKFWTGHDEGDMSDLYDRSREDLQYPKDVAKAMEVGFDLRQTLTAKRTKEEKTSLTGVIGRQAETVEACKWLKKWLRGLDLNQRPPATACEAGRLKKVSREFRAQEHGE